MNYFEKDLVSVIIPVYNRMYLLERAIESVLNQGYKNIEIIIVDDCSQDNPKKIIDKYLYGRIKYIKHKKNYGANKARNTGIKKSRGEFIAFLDSDDEWVNDKIEKQLKVFNNSKSIDVVYCGVKYIYNTKNIKVALPKVRGYIFFKELFRDHVFSTSTWLVKKQCLYDIGLFDENLPARQDYDLTLRLSKKFIYDFVDEPLVFIHYDAMNRITNNVKNRICGSLKVLEKILEEIDNRKYFLKNRVLGSHYYQIARYAYENKDEETAKKYFLKGVTIFPLSFKCLLFYFLSLCGKKIYYMPSNIIFFKHYVLKK